MTSIPFKCYILDEENHVVEVDVITWGRWFERIENRTIGYTEIVSGTTVSTIFIGIDHRHYGEGPPVLFETMVFGGPLDGEIFRYSSYDDAETGHAATVRRARAAILATASTAQQPATRVPHSVKAQLLGVSTKTLDRWSEGGILPPPDIVNGRKYHDIDSRPCLDRGRRPRNPPPRRSK
jgi:hypothetical protein